MKKQLFGLSLVVAATIFTIVSHDPIKDSFNFIIAGVIPGTRLSIGFWPTLGVILCILWLMKKVIANLHFQMIRHSALQYNAEKTLAAELPTPTATNLKKARTAIAAADLTTNTSL